MFPALNSSALKAKGVQLIKWLMSVNTTPTLNEIQVYKKK